MKRIWGHLVTAGIVAGIGGVMLPACAHNDSSLFVRDIAFPPMFVAGQGCIYPPASASQPSLFSGHFDVGLSSSYSPVVVVGNQLTARGDPLNERTETARVQLRGAIVRVTDSVGNELSSFTSLTDGFVDPSEGSDPSFGQAAVTIINPPTAKVLRAELTTRANTKTLLTYFKIFGQTLGGTYVESGETQFVVTACNGCLVTFPSDSKAPPAKATATTPAIPELNCVAPVPAVSAALEIPCQQGQESSIDCRFCQGLPACDPANP